MRKVLTGEHAYDAWYVVVFAVCALLYAVLWSVDAPGWASYVVGAVEATVLVGLIAAPRIEQRGWKKGFDRARELAQQHPNNFEDWGRGR